MILMNVTVRTNPEPENIRWNENPGASRSQNCLPHSLQVLATGQYWREQDNTDCYHCASTACQRDSPALERRETESCWFYVMHNAGHCSQSSSKCLRRGKKIYISDLKPPIYTCLSKGPPGLNEDGSTGNGRARCSTSSVDYLPRHPSSTQIPPSLPLLPL